MDTKNIFWGLIIKPGKRYETEVQEPFRITKACIEPSTSKDGKVTSVMVEVDSGEEFIITNLSLKSFNETLDLSFNEGEKICFKVEGPGTVHLTGKLMDTEEGPPEDMFDTKTTYRIQDESGEVEVIQWVEDGQTLDEFAEGTSVKVFGSIRTNQGKRNMMAFKVGVISSQAEYDAHLLEVVYTKLKLRQLNQRINGQIGMSDGMSQSMMGGGLSVQGGGGGGHAGGQSFGNKNYDLVYSVIKQSFDEAGCDRDTVFIQAKKLMSKTEMDNALDFLSSEGHIYSTIDEDHFKTTDGE